MTLRKAPLLALTLAALLALATPGSSQAQQADSLQQLQQLSDSLQQTAQRLQQTAQRLQQTAQRLQNLNARQQQMASTSDSTTSAASDSTTSATPSSSFNTTSSSETPPSSDSTSTSADTTTSTTTIQTSAVPADTAGAAMQQSDTTSQQAGQQTSAQQPSLDETLSALEGDVTQADPNAAVGLLNEWEQALRATDKQNLVSLASNLKQLREELQKPSIVDARVGQLLSEIGEQTSEAASSAGSSDAEKLRQLGGRLSSAGEKLSSNDGSQTSDSTMQSDSTRQSGSMTQRSDSTMQSDSTSTMQSDSASQQAQDTSATSQAAESSSADRSQQQSDLNATIVAFEQDVTGLDPVMAVGNIDGWEKALSSSGDQELQSIGEDLKTLKSELQKSSVDGQKVGEVLSTLGEKTTQAAAKADPALSPQLLQLGSLLSDAGKQLSGDQEDDDGEQ
ncbi:MAG: hypothetical protein ACR2GR_10780 [Rhodothermales bacterium]